MNQQQIRSFHIQKSSQSFQDIDGDLGKILVFSHNVQVTICPDPEKSHHLIQHFPMLPRQAYFADNLLMLLQFQYQWTLNSPYIAHKTTMFPIHDLIHVSVTTFILPTRYQSDIYIFCFSVLIISINYHRQIIGPLPEFGGYPIPFFIPEQTMVYPQLIVFLQVTDAQFYFINDAFL